MDIRLDGAGAPTFDDLDRFVQRVKPDYPQVQKAGEIRAEVRADLRGSNPPEVTHSASAEPFGYLCLSADRKAIVQPRVNGFVFSKLRPYDRWTTFRDEARRLFEMYREEFGEPAISRVAIRTINRLDIPLDGPIDFKDWIRTGPEISPDLPQAIAGFLMQVQQPYDDLSAHCVITETLVPPEVPNTLAVILDIDLFRTTEIPQNLEELWSLFGDLRAKKNEIFLGCITDRMKETFK